jgi:uncharacterized membrane protein YiaA
VDGVTKNKNAQLEAVTDQHAAVVSRGFTTTVTPQQMMSCLLSIALVTLRVLNARMIALAELFFAQRAQVAMSTATSTQKLVSDTPSATPRLLQV